MARIEAIRVAEQQDEDREGAKSLIGNDKDLGTYSQCCSKHSLKREF